MDSEQEVPRKEDPTEEEEGKTCYYRCTGCTKATNDIEAVINIDNTIGDIAHVYKNNYFLILNKTRRKKMICHLD